jgi:hypothetical protein
MRTIIPLLVLLPFAACPPKNIPAAVSYAPKTTLTSTSARCSAGSCSCRSLESGEGQTEEQIPAGHKRFELRLPRTTSAIWVEVEGKGVYYKPPEQVLPSCFYVDLPSGEHRLTLHAEKRDPEVGLQTALAIFEHGAKDGPHWYRSLDFLCGGTNTCTKSGMESYLSFQRGLPRGVLDPCGSVMIRGVTITGSRADKQDPEYLDLTLRLRMKIYGFETYRAPNSPECRAPVKNRPESVE